MRRREEREGWRRMREKERERERNLERERGRDRAACEYLLLAGGED